jgi:hypothetical protein
MLLACAECWLWNWIIKLANDISNHPLDFVTCLATILIGWAALKIAKQQGKISEQQKNLHVLEIKRLARKALIQMYTSFNLIYHNGRPSNQNERSDYLTFKEGMLEIKRIIHNDSFEYMSLCLDCSKIIFKSKDINMPMKVCIDHGLYLDKLMINSSLEELYNKNFNEMLKKYVDEVEVYNIEELVPFLHIEINEYYNEILK